MQQLELELGQQLELEQHGEYERQGEQGQVEQFSELGHGEQMEQFFLVQLEQLSMLEQMG